MHPYVTDSDERLRVPLWIAFLSLLLSWGVHLFLDFTKWSPHWILDVPSFAGFYWILTKWFDKKLWKLSIFRKIGLVKVPYIAGKWDGYLTSSYDKHQTEIKAAVEIKQTWTELQITLQTGNSVSRSETASILTKIPDVALLSYEYFNEPRAHAVLGMQIHRGTARHEYQVNTKHELLDGGYYTGRGRETFGNLYFKRKPNT